MGIGIRTTLTSPLLVPAYVLGNGLKMGNKLYQPK